MSSQWVRRPEGIVRRAVVTLLVLSAVHASVHASDQVASEEAPSTVSTAVLKIPPLVFERSVGKETRGGALALTGQGGRSAENSGHWCAGGLALLVGGAAAAVIAGVRHDPNPQKPNPSVGVVLGTGAAAVGGVEMIRACKRPGG
jgi:hypothetical protein